MSDPSLSFARRGISSVNKVILLSFVAIALLMLDSRFAAVQTVKRYAAAALYPLQWLANQPVEWYEYSSAFLQSQAYLLGENQRLVQENARLKMEAHHTDVQRQELSDLKSLMVLHHHGLPVTVAAEVISDGKEPLSTRIIINKGSRDGVQQGDAVVDQYGLLGQVSQAHPLTAEITMLTDSNIVIPVMLARTHIRSLAHGGGGKIALRYFPTDADLKIDDVLVTSGIDSVYPAGIPVASVTQIGRNAGTPYYRVDLKPMAAMQKSKYVLVLPQTSLPETLSASAASAVATSIP
ncbi:MAG: rod shape-determining protein MreC [Alysiella sp.]|uniref:rod shape-determining protein MreC n=1 Tax=Alysiella sp. TaxID=1872483 RepID=UPI0026DB2754|nr:rod shape-determining protein MreC [Alysiella sp.]MDO4434540.1 rod shape-determining protein MreC [Alysiella sp.]